VTRAAKSRRADCLSSDKAELQTVDKAKVVRERDLARTANITANIEFAFTLSHPTKKGLFNVIVKLLSTEEREIIHS